MTRIRWIVFELDETLVHATEVPLPYAHTLQVAPYPPRKCSNVQCSAHVSFLASGVGSL